MCRITYQNFSLIGSIVFLKSCQPGEKTLFREKRVFTRKRSEKGFYLKKVSLTVNQRRLLHKLSLLFLHNLHFPPILRFYEPPFALEKLYCSSCSKCPKMRKIVASKCVLSRAPARNSSLPLQLKRPLFP